MSLCAYLAAALGLPLPAAAPPRQTSEPFPCMDHPCGCRTAEQCWTSCCCLTVEERWAWARAHHVQPPAYAERPAATEAGEGWNRRPLREQAQGKAVSRERRTCCEAAKTCCSDPPCGRGCSGSHPSPPAGKASPAGGVRWVLGFSAQHCQALTTLWLTTGATLPSPGAVAWAPAEPPAEWLPFTDTSARLLSRSPPSPPPR